MQNNSTLTETLYGLVEGPSQSSDMMDVISEEEYQKNLEKYNQEDARLRANGSLPPTEQQRIAEGRPVKLYTNVSSAYEDAQDKQQPAKLYDSTATQPINTDTTDANKDFTTALAKQLAELDAVKNDDAVYAEKLAQVMSSMAAKDAEFKKEAQLQAHAKYGIPALEAQVNNLKKLEQMSYTYRQKFGNIDSPEVTAAKQQLMHARNAADSSIPETLAGNSAYQALHAYSKTLIETVAGSTERDRRKNEIADANAIERLSAYTPEQRDTISRLTGFTDPRQQFQFLKNNPKNLQQIDAVVQAAPQEVPVLALRGNQFAGKLVADSEKEVFGTEAPTRLKQVTDVATDMVTANKAFVEMKNTGYLTDKVKEWEKDMSAALLGIEGKKAQQEASQHFRERVAVEYGQFKAKQEFTSDVIGVQNRASVPAPDWLVSASKDPKVSGNGKITLDQALGLATKDVPNDIAQARTKEFIDYYSSAIAKQNDSTFFKIEPFFLESVVASASRKKANLDSSGYGLFPRIGDTLSSAFKTGMDAYQAGAVASVNQDNATVFDPAAAATAGFLFGQSKKGNQ